jgi:flagellar basal-body rod protein FlgB
MADPIFNDYALRALSFALDGLSLRQRATAHNIANVDTPGYKAQHVSFESQLKHVLDGDAHEPGAALHTTAPNHLGGRLGVASPLVGITQRSNDLRNDGNNVDIDLEMTTLAETTQRYQALAQLAGSKLALLKSMVRDAR